MTRPFKTLLSLLLGTLLVLGAAGCSPGPAGGTAVTVVKAEKKTVSPSTTLEGVLVPVETAEVSSRISGQVTAVTVKAGDTVKAGQTLLTLDDRALAAQLVQAEAGRQTAQAGQEVAQGQAELTKITLAAAQKNFDRIDSLFKSGAASQSQLDDAADRLSTARRQHENASGPSKSQARASLSTAEAAVSNLKVQLAYTLLTSPIDGIVTIQNATVGETVAIGTSLVTVADTNTLKLKGTITQDLIPFLKMGQAVPVTVGIFPDLPVQGKLTGIGPMAVSTGELFPVEITLSNDGKLMAGLTASAVLETAGLERLVIPEAAIIQESGKQIVYVIQDGKALRREVIIGFRHQQEAVVLKGVQAGELIAVTGSGSLKDQMPVTVRP